jgi:hypothetical protein
MGGVDRATNVLRRIAGVTFALCAMGLSIAAVPATPEAPASTEEVPELDEVVVTGRIPGPPLWKVSKDDRVLWILPLIDAYPRNIEWNSARVEALIAQSQEFIERPLANWGVSTANPFTMARLMGAARRYRRLDKGEKLADLLPPGLYQRYEALRSRYFPRDASMETLRVSVAGMQMQRAIMDREDLETLNYRSLGSPRPITQELYKWLKRNKSIRRTSPAYRTGHRLGFGETGTLSKAIEDASANEAYRRWELDCFEKVLVYFEEDFARVKRRANDWAQGRADELVDAAPLRGLGNACNFPPLIPEGSPQMEELRQKEPHLVAGLAPMLTGNREEGESISRQRWLEAAEAALVRNEVTFSVLAVEDVVGEDSLVSRLRDKGYVISISAEDAVIPVL